MKYVFEYTLDFKAALEQGSISENSEIRFKDSRSGEDAAVIAAALKSPNCPQGLQIHLDWHKIGEAGAKTIATALGSGQCSQGLQIDLRWNKLNAAGVQAIAAVLKSGKCPRALHIRLGSNNIGAAGATAIAVALQSGKCPQGLHVDLTVSGIQDVGAQAIATALQSGQCPQGLQINLAGNRISPAGVRAIAAAFQSSNCPQGLQINLEANNFGKVGAEAIATALQSGKCPQGLQINLKENDIGYMGAEAIAIALQTGKCPQGLKIHLEWNSIGPRGVQAIVTAILSGKCPSGLRLHGIEGFSKHLNKSLKTFLEVGSQEWPILLNAIRGVFCYEPRIVMEDNELVQTIQNILEDYIRSLQASIKDNISEEDYRESYFPLLQDISEVILAIVEKSSGASDTQKKWASDLMQTVAESILPEQLSPGTLSVWTHAQRLIFLEKAFSLFPDATASTFLANHWQCFCDEFNEIPQSERIFQPNGDVACIKENEANAKAVAYYNQVLKEGFVLPEIELAKQMLSTNMSQTDFFQQQQQRSTDEEIPVDTLYVGQSPAA